MARKRMFYPEFWHDPKVLRLKTAANKLTFRGLISLCDDEALITADPVSLRSDIHANQLGPKVLLLALAKIEELQLAIKYKAGNSQDYYIIVNFYKHQNIEYPQPTKHPRPPEDLVRKYPQYVQGLQKTFNSPYVHKILTNHSEKISEYSPIVKLSIVK